MLFCVFILFIACLVSVDVVNGQNCVQPSQRKITGDCTHTDTTIYLAAKSTDVDLKVANSPAITQTLTINLSIGKCPITAKAYNVGGDGNLISMGHDNYGHTIRLRVTQSGIKILLIDPEREVGSDPCVAQFDQSEASQSEASPGNQFKLQIVLDLSAAETSFYLQLDDKAGFSGTGTTTTTRQPLSATTTNNKQVPTWAYILIVIVILIVVFIMAAVVICIFYCIQRKRKESQKKADVGVSCNIVTPRASTGMPPPHSSVISSFFDSIPNEFDSISQE